MKTRNSGGTTHGSRRGQFRSARNCTGRYVPVNASHNVGRYYKGRGCTTANGHRAYGTGRGKGLAGSIGAS